MIFDNHDEEVGFRLSKTKPIMDAEMYDQDPTRDDIELELEKQLFGNDNVFINDVPEDSDSASAFIFKPLRTQELQEVEHDSELAHLDDAEVSRENTSFLCFVFSSFAQHGFLM